VLIGGLYPQFAPGHLDEGSTGAQAKGDAPAALIQGDDAQAISGEAGLAGPVLAEPAATRRLLCFQLGPLLTALTLASWTSSLPTSEPFRLHHRSVRPSRSSTSSRRGLAPNDSTLLLLVNCTELSPASAALLSEAPSGIDRLGYVEWLAWISMRTRACSRADATLAVPLAAYVTPRAATTPTPLPPGAGKRASHRASRTRL
jgi:hypothetical protein